MTKQNEMNKMKKAVSRDIETVKTYVVRVYQINMKNNNMKLKMISENLQYIQCIMI